MGTWAAIERGRERRECGASECLPLMPAPEPDHERRASSAYVPVSSPTQHRADSTLRRRETARLRRESAVFHFRVECSDRPPWAPSEKLNKQNE